MDFVARSPRKNKDANRQSLRAEDWAQAALDAMAVKGLDAVAVEPLARQLGVTKGSFYWHFANRDALLNAALERWEQDETELVLSRVDAVADPYERIVALFKQANSSYRSGRLYLALAAAADHPAVNAIVERVSQRRLNYLFDCYRSLGMSEREAGHWSRFAYATFVGNLQIRRDVPDAIPEGAAFAEYLKLMIKTLIPRARGEEIHPQPEPTANAQAHPDVVPLRKTGSD